MRSEFRVQGFRVSGVKGLMRFGFLDVLGAFRGLGVKEGFWGLGF